MCRKKGVCGGEGVGEQTEGERSVAPTGIELENQAFGLTRN